MKPGENPESVAVSQVGGKASVRFWGWFAFFWGTPAVIALCMGAGGVDAFSPDTSVRLRELVSLTCHVLGGFIAAAAANHMDPFGFLVAAGYCAGFVWLRVWFQSHAERGRLALVSVGAGVFVASVVWHMMGLAFYSLRFT